MLFRKLRCSFCRRADTDVAKLVKGARGYICDRCAHEAVRIMETTPPADAESRTRGAVLQNGIAEWNRSWHFTSAIVDGR
jgi:ATP-dependent protease Clp ATPase subunit